MEMEMETLKKLGRYELSMSTTTKSLETRGKMAEVFPSRPYGGHKRHIVKTSPGIDLGVVKTCNYSLNHYLPTLFLIRNPQQGKYECL